MRLGLNITMRTYPFDGQGLRAGPPPAHSLAGLRPGATGRVATLGGDVDGALALMEMGLAPGAEVRVIRHAPLGCPIEIAVGSARFAIRRETARLVGLVPHE